MNPISRGKQLCLSSAWILRHIFFSFNLPVVTVGALWSCFYALIMRRPIKDDCFAAATTIWNNAMALQSIDKKIKTKKFCKAISKKTKHGFQRYFYSSSDDSKHFKLNRHVLVVSTFELDSEECVIGARSGMFALLLLW